MVNGLDLSIGELTDALDGLYANYAAIILENRSIPLHDKLAVRSALAAFIGHTCRPEQSYRFVLGCRDLALHSAIRKFIWLQEPGDFVHIDWLADTIAPSDLEAEVVFSKTLLDFLLHEPPAPCMPQRLVGWMTARCERFLDSEAKAPMEHRIVAVDSLLCLVLLSAPGAGQLMEMAHRRSSGFAKSMQRRYREMQDSLLRRGRTSPEMLERALGWTIE